MPDANSERGARRLLERVTGLGPDDLVLALISGGGSALLALPAPGLTLADKQAVNRALLASGATIGEMNAVRKHLSAIKGGRLAAAAAPARVVTLAISDVPGDDPAVIASGPTVPDPTTCADALALLTRYRDRAAGRRRGTLRDSEARHLPQASFRLIATPMMALDRAAEVARAQGLTPLILGDALEGESREVGTVMAGIARSVRAHAAPLPAPAVLLSGGETTVTIGAARPDAAGATRSSCSASPSPCKARPASGRPPAIPTGSTGPRTRRAPSSRRTRWPARAISAWRRARCSTGTTATRCSASLAT